MQEIDLIFQQYYRPLCLYATHYLHDIDEAEDVVQDCFVKLIVSVSAFIPCIIQKKAVTAD